MSSILFLAISKYLLSIGGIVFCILILFNSINFANSWEQILYGLNSAQPFYKQIQMIVVSMIVGTIAISLFKISAWVDIYCILS